MLSVGMSGSSSRLSRSAPLAGCEVAFNYFVWNQLTFDSLIAFQVYLGRGTSSGLGSAFWSSTYSCTCQWVTSSSHLNLVEAPCIGFVPISVASSRIWADPVIYSEGLNQLTRSFVGWSCRDWPSMAISHLFKLFEHSFSLRFRILWILAMLFCAYVVQATRLRCLSC